MSHKVNYTQHNRPEKPKYNPGKFGKVWGGMHFKHKHGLNPVGEANQPIIGTLHIDGKKVELTFSECNRLIDILDDAKTISRTANRLGQTSNSAGSPIGFMEAMSER